MRNPDPSPTRGRIEPLPFEDPDITLPLEQALPASTPDVWQTAPPLQTALTPWRPAYWYIAGLAAACFALATLVLLVDLGRTDAHVPTQAIVNARPPVILVDGEPFGAVTEAQPPAPSPEETQTAAPEEPTDARQVPRRQASAVRRQCMAQIESANLFRGIARNSANAEAYAGAVDLESDRLLSAGTVEQRTLATIANEAWANRAKADLAANWWTRQYQRCESRGIAGADYIVRSD